jgi:hypothetical protein
MARINRYNLSDINPQRIKSAINNRIAEIPHNLAWFISKKAVENKSAIMSYHNIHKNKRCFIVANGPSINVTNLDYLKNEFSFGLNRIYLNFEKSEFRPTYFLTMNELILEQFGNEISRLEMPKFVNWNRRALFDTKDRSIIYLKSKMVFQDDFQNDLTQPLVVGGTVTFVALQLAFYMGFSEVIIVGLDHKYDEKGTPSVSVTRNEEKDSSHFHPNYFPKGSKWQPPDLVRSEIDFSIALDFFTKNGRTIKDATINGHCPIFEKTDYYSLF